MNFKDFSVIQAKKWYLLLIIMAVLVLAVVLILVKPENVSYGSITNGGFENGNFSGWELFGDPNVCGKEPGSVCPTVWCDLRNQSCRVQGMIVEISNKTLFGDKIAVLGHEYHNFGLEAQSKVDIRQNLIVPNNSPILSFHMKMDVMHITEYYSGTLFGHYVIIEHDGTEDVIWKFDEIQARDHENWEQVNFRLSEYTGKNVTLIFRFKQETENWWYGVVHTDLWYIDEVKIEGERSRPEWEIDAGLIEEVEKEAQKRNTTSSVVVEDILNRHFHSFRLF